MAIDHSRINVPTQLRWKCAIIILHCALARPTAISGVSWQVVWQINLLEEQQKRWRVFSTRVNNFAQKKRKKRKEERFAVAAVSRVMLAAHLLAAEVGVVVVRMRHLCRHPLFRVPVWSSIGGTGMGMATVAAVATACHVGSNFETRQKQWPNRISHRLLWQPLVLHSWRGMWFTSQLI